MALKFYIFIPLFFKKDESTILFRGWLFFARQNVGKVYIIIIKASLIVWNALDLPEYCGRSSMFFAKR